MRMPRFTPWLVVVTLTAAGAAAAAGYGLTAPKRYSATAQLLVVPVSASDSTFAGLDVLRESSTRRTAAATAAELVRSPQVADAVRAQLGLRQSTQALLGELDADVAGSSDVVDVTVQDASATAAAQVANAFVDALIAQRTATFQSALSSTIRRVTQLVGSVGGAQAAELGRRLAVLRSFQGQPDPTLRRADVAVAPTASSWPDLARLIAVGTGAGLAAGVLLAAALLTLRRRRPSDLSAYDRPVGESSDRAAHELADRLEQRLAAREKALAARERDLQARIDELRALDAEGLAERERQLEERAHALTQRELELTTRVSASEPPSEEAGQVDGRDRALAEREAALAEREQVLEERISTLTKRELALARQAAALRTAPEPDELAAREAAVAERERTLEQRLAAVEERELDASRRAAPPPAAVPPPAPPPAPQAAPADGTGTYNLISLERLVEDRAGDYPDRTEEWRSYLFFLRDYAGPDGALPASFDWLILDTFREIVA